MPGISVEGKRYPSVSTEIFGKRDGKGSEVTLVIVREDSVQMMEHHLLVEFAREVLLDDRVALTDYADQVLAPHPLNGHYQPVFLALDHNGNTSKLVLATAQGGRLYEWDI
jgi:hypothetical protein